MSALAVIDRDFGWDELRRVFEDRELAGRGITLNVKAPVHYAVYVEYGHFTLAGNYVQPRPFMRWTFDEHSNYHWQINRLATELLRGRIRGGGGRFISASQRLQEFGAHVVADVQKTIDRMGLIDTGALRASIVATVTKDGA